MKNRKASRLCAVALTLCMMVWALAGCGGGETYSASEISSEAAYAAAVQGYYDNIDMDYAYDLTYELAYNWDDYAEACGWRTSGSDAEHACAEYLAKEMKKIGLSNVEKVGTKCDKFQFNSSSLKIEGSDVDFKGGSKEAVEAQTNGPASYQVNGTDGDLTAKIVNVGMGSKYEYADAGFEKGDIAFVQVDQSAEAWIDVVIYEAYTQGASAVVTWANSGYGEAGAFTNNTQDVCSEDLIPAVSVSGEQAEKIAAAIEAGHDKATLNVDAVMEDNTGITYNVCGMIPGKNHDQKIIVSGHYDKYWYGFQDDCAAIGLVLATAKAMVESGYEPENDIYFVCHGAEEWGSTNSMFDWTTGAWGMCDDEDFADDVIAMLNYELPAFDVGDNLIISCVPEFSNLNTAILDDGIVVTEGEQSIAYTTTDTTTMEDGISYREYGTPYFLNGFEGTDFMCDNYHTIADNKDTYNEDVFKTNINWTGAYAIYVDNHPALALDFTTTAERLKADFNEDYATEAGVDIEAYNAAIDELSAAGEALNEQVADINSRYAEAVASGDTAAAEAARAEGTALNKKSLEAFQMVQDAFLKVTDFGSDYGHTPENSNVEALDGVLGCLEAGEGPVWGEDGDGIGDYLCGLNAACEYNYCNYSMATGDRETAAHEQSYYADKDQAMWGWNHLPDQVHTGKASAQIFAVEDVAELSDEQIAEFTKVYTEARGEMIESIGKWSNQEIEDCKAIAAALQ